MNKILKIALLVLIVITIISTASYCSAPYDTETAHKVNIQKTVEGSGYILRNETVVAVPGEGIFEPGIKVGDRVSKGASVGTFTSGTLDETLVSHLSDVTQRINEIKQSDSISALYASDEARICSVMKNLSEDIRQNCIDGDFHTASLNTRQLEILVQKKNTVENATADDKLLLSLEQEKYELEQQLGGIREDVASPASGYYYSELDGLEGTYTDESLSLITAETISGYENILKEDEKKSTSGKIADSYIWYLAAVIPQEEAQNLTVGSKVSVSLDSSAFVSAKVITLNASENGDTALVLKCDRALPGVYEKRTVQFEICYAEYTGLYVPSAAIRVIDDITGVYVMNKSNNIEFKCVNILHEEDNYYIVSDNFTPPENSTYSPLKNYDNILVNPEVTNLDRKPAKKS